MSRRDPYFEQLPTEKIGLYQFFLNRLFADIDVWNYTAWSARQEYDRDRMKVDDEVLRRIVVDEAAAAELDSDLLSMMFHQFVFADTVLREIHKKAWVSKVLAREPTDYFPDPRLLESVLAGAFGEPSS